jgi:hypothetical protein
MRCAPRNIWASVYLDFDHVMRDLVPYIIMHNQTRHQQKYIYISLSLSLSLSLFLYIYTHQGDKCLFHFVFHFGWGCENKYVEQAFAKEFPKPLPKSLRKVQSEMDEVLSTQRSIAEPHFRVWPENGFCVPLPHKIQVNGHLSGSGVHFRVRFELEPESICEEALDGIQLSGCRTR